VFRSSEFHMAEGDILHILLKEETGALADIRLVSGGDTANVDEVPDAPIALPASDITDTSFTANWHFMENTSGYYLDVATDEDFTAFVVGYEDVDVGLVNEYSVTGLISDMTYYYRVRAYNDIGTGVNSNIITVSVVISVIIGTQEWMVNNISVDIVGSYVYNDNEANRAIYGGLYSYALLSDIEDLYPGWHVPSSAEWQTLSDYLGGDVVSGGHLKETGVIHWNAPNTGADNTSGFTALGAGIREPGGAYRWNMERAYFWASNDYIATSLYYNSAQTILFLGGVGATYNLSVRLIKG